VSSLRRYAIQIDALSGKVENVSRDLEDALQEDVNRLQLVLAILDDLFCEIRGMERPAASPPCLTVWHDGEQCSSTAPASIVVACPSMVPKMHSQAQYI
jgi:hypothetical protein